MLYRVNFVSPNIFLPCHTGHFNLLFPKKNFQCYICRFRDNVRILITIFKWCFQIQCFDIEFANKIFWNYVSQNGGYINPRRSQINYRELKVISYGKIFISRWKQINTTTLSTRKKNSTTNHYNINFKFIAIILIESYETEILISLSSPRLAEQPSTPREFKTFLLFAWSYRWLPSSPLGHFLSLERKTMKRDMSFFSRHVYSRTQCYYQGRIESSGLSSAALGDGFQLSWSNTQREEQETSKKFSANILQAFAQIIS